jgi:transposase, IS6 family
MLCKMAIFARISAQCAKRITKPMMGFKSFISASKTIKGIEAMNMIRKGQVSSNKSVLFEVQFINQLFGIVS